MPARDGTGPKGTGPAGRGLGPCATTAGRRFLGLGRGFRGGGGGGARARGDGFGLGYGYGLRGAGAVQTNELPKSERERLSAVAETLRNDLEQVRAQLREPDRSEDGR